MAEQKGNFALPKKLDSYLATLSRIYEKSGEKALHEIVVNSAATIHEGWDYDNWNGGTYGHAVTLLVPEDIFLPVRNDLDSIQKRLVSDLQDLAYTSNEYISEVFVEMEPSEDGDWRTQSGVLRPRLGSVSVPAEALQRIWGSGHLRVFLSHKSTIKIETEAFKQSLAKCGISAFVAHTDIEPTEEWAREIERALFSADALVALLSKDFHDSHWTDQEVGVAIGRGIPVIAVRLGIDPYGLIGKAQGVGGCSWEKPDEMAARVFAVLHKKLADKSRLFECALDAYRHSESFADSAWKVKNLLSLFQKLTAEQVEGIVSAYEGNRQNRDSFDGTALLKPHLEKWTGRNWKIKNKTLVLPDIEDKDEVPF